MSHRGTFRSRLALCLAAGVVAAVAWGRVGLDDLGGPLRAIALEAARGGMGTASANKLGLRTRGNQVAVTVVFSSEAAAAATGLGSYGGTVELRRDRRVQALIPADRLVSIASLPQVAQIVPAATVRPLQGFGAVSSEGVQLTNATAMHLAGFNGQGVKVAVIDGGFAGLTAAEVPVLPAAIVNFRADLNTTATNHGTGVAQIVADLAPACSMTLIAVNTELEAEAAIDYVIDQRFHVVNFSMGVTTGPFDGTHPLSQAVNRARTAGIFWVNAAGNEAQRHWEGTWRNTDGDAALEFVGSKDYINIDLPAGTFRAYLSWYQTAGAETANDYDLVLYDSSGLQVASSAVTQNGDDPPRETLLAYVPAAGTYRLQIEGRSIPNTSYGPDMFQLFTEADLEASLQKSENSLVIPAEATGAFSVGATRGVTATLAGQPAVNLDRIEPFSSRGALLSNAKPEMVAPDGVATSVTPGLNPFMGTSAAAPHVAGAVALLLSENTGRSIAVMRSLLNQMARHYVVGGGPDDITDADVNAYGFGRLALRVGVTTDSDLPAVRINFPQNNSTITVASPVVRAECNDTGGVDPNTIQVWLDGTQVVVDGVPVPGSAVTDYDFTDGALTFMLGNLTRTRHTLAIRCKDLAGNESELATSNFRITTQTIAAGLHIISLPYPALATLDPSAVFGVPLDQMALLRWVPTDSRFSKYHVYPDEFASFQPPDGLVSRPPCGLGYFLSLPVTGTLNVTASGLTEPSYNIQLVYGVDPPRGWNLIGNPYEDYVDWGGVEFLSTNGRQDLREAMEDSSPVTEGTLFGFVSNAGGGYYSFESDPTQATMEPLKGYWLHVLKNATLIVHNSVVAADAPAAPARPRRKPAAPSNDNWTLQLQARAGKYEDPINYIGVSSAASDGYDAGVDVSEPPPLVDSLRLYMPASTGDYAKDMRSAVSARQQWDVEVACRLTDTPVTVSWPTLNAAVPSGVTLRLEDVDTGASVYMRTATNYTFRMSEPGVRRLRIVASTDTAASLAMTGVSVASVRGGGVVLTYAVTREANVGVEIRNLSGVLIRNLGQRAASPGTAQTVLWNAQNEHGAQVPPGRYLVRMTARAADGQSVQAIRPFEVRR